MAALIDGYFDGSAPIQFDYNLLRGPGEPIKASSCSVGARGRARGCDFFWVGSHFVIYNVPFTTQGFGGHSSGPGALQELHIGLRNVLDGLTGQAITVTAIVDMMNLIGKCVVSGNVCAY